MTFRKVDTRLWNDAKVRQLSDDGKLAFLFVLTHPALTAVGAMRATLPGLAAELGWAERRFRRAFEPAIALGMVEVDEGAAFLAFPNFLRFNGPQGPNSVKPWLAALDLIPECAAKRRLLERCRGYLDAKPDDFRHAIGDAILDAFRDAMPDPREGDGEGAGAVSSPPTPQGADGAARTDESLAWLGLLNQEAGRQFRPTPANLSPIRARIREGYKLAQAGAVVRGKVTEWKGTERAQYLRPSTLFGPKFDGYLQAAANGNDRHAAGRGNAAWDGVKTGEVRL
jgi:uncharacterized phage protein (TIGR02220 family)